MGVLLARVADPAELADAWKQVLANDAADQTLSAGVRRFAADSESLLAELSAQLVAGQYRPRSLTEIAIPKDAGGQRVLHVPAVRDRVVERSVLVALTPLVDPLLGPSSYAYRPGLGVVDAVQDLARLREEGLAWVLRTDIDDCFPTIDTYHNYVVSSTRCGGAEADLDQAIQVVDLTPPADPHRSLYLSNLGNALRVRYAHRHAIDDLDQTVSVCRAALAAASPEYFDRPGCLSNLGGALLARFSHTQRPDDLSSAIDALAEAAGSAPADSPESAAFQVNLGNALRTRFDAAGDVTDGQRARHLLREVARAETAPVTQRVNAARW